MPFSGLTFLLVSELFIKRRSLNDSLSACFRLILVVYPLRRYYVVTRTGRKGRTRRVTIGRHGEITPPSARAEAKRLLGEIAAGRDPAAERDKAKADKSLGRRARSIHG